MRSSRFALLAVPLALSALLAACGGGSDGAAAVTGGLTLSESYKAGTNGALDVSKASGTNSSETNAGFNSGRTYCALRYSGITIAGGTTQYDVSLYFDLASGDALFVGILESANFENFNIGASDATELAKVKIDKAAKTATVTGLLLKTDTDASKSARLDGTLAYAGAGGAGCGS